MTDFKPLSAEELDGLRLAVEDEFPDAGQRLIAQARRALEIPGKHQCPSCNEYYVDILAERESENADLKAEVERLKEALIGKLTEDDAGNEFTYVMVLKDEVSRLTAALETAEKALEKAKLIDGSMSAAEVEGLEEALRETEDERLKDLLNRRILWHWQEFREALATIGKHRGK